MAAKKARLARPRKSPQEWLDEFPEDSVDFVGPDGKTKTENRWSRRQLEAMPHDQLVATMLADGFEKSDVDDALGDHELIAWYMDDDPEESEPSAPVDSDDEDEQVATVIRTGDAKLETLRRALTASDYDDPELADAMNNHGQGPDASDPEYWTPAVMHSVVTAIDLGYFDGSLKDLALAVRVRHYALVDGTAIVQPPRVPVAAQTAVTAPTPRIGNVMPGTLPGSSYPSHYLAPDELSKVQLLDHVPAKTVHSGRSTSLPGFVAINGSIYKKTDLVGLHFRVPSNFPAPEHGRGLVAVIVKVGYKNIDFMLCEPRRGRTIDDPLIMRTWSAPFAQFSNLLGLSRV